MSPSPPSPEAAEIGRQLRLLITASGRPMRDIAEAVAMHPSQLSRIARGTAGDLRVTTVSKIAAALGSELRIVPLGKGAGDDSSAA